MSGCDVGKEGGVGEWQSHKKLTTGLYVVATPIGNLADLSLRAKETLAAVDRIAAEDTRHTQHLLNHFGIRTPLLAAHQHNEEEAAQRILVHLAAGESVALVSDAGTPGISDPGCRVVSRVREAGWPVFPVPGACALVAAVSASGLAEEGFTFVGFLPAKASQRDRRIDELARWGGAIALYEAPHRVLETVEALASGLGADRRLVIARELTKQFESIHQLPLGEARAWLEEDANRIRGEFVLVVGAPLPWTQEGDGEFLEAERVLKVLMAEELPVKQVARIAASLTGLAKNRLYDMALSIRQATQDRIGG